MMKHNMRFELKQDADCKGKTCITFNLPVLIDGAFKVPEELCITKHLQEYMICSCGYEELVFPYESPAIHDPWEKLLGKNKNPVTIDNIFLQNFKRLSVRFNHISNSYQSEIEELNERLKKLEKGLDKQ